MFLFVFYSSWDDKLPPESLQEGRVSPLWWVTMTAGV